jgi:hypothetical protein
MAARGAQRSSISPLLRSCNPCSVKSPLPHWTPDYSRTMLQAHPTRTLRFGRLDTWRAAGSCLQSESMRRTGQARRFKYRPDEILANHRGQKLRPFCFIQLWPKPFRVNELTEFQELQEFHHGELFSTKFGKITDTKTDTDSHPLGPSLGLCSQAMTEQASTTKRCSD